MSSSVKVFNFLDVDKLQLKSVPSITVATLGAVFIAFGMGDKARAATFSVPDFNTVDGAITGFLLAENKNPAYKSYSAADALKSMQAMNAVVYNRLKAPSYFPNFGVENPENAFDIIGASGQFAGFSRTNTGIKVSDNILTNIKDIINIANAGEKDQRSTAYQEFVTNALNVSKSDYSGNSDPFFNFGGSYFWRTSGSSAPSSFSARIPQSEGTIQNNDFYTVKGVDIAFVIDTTGSMTPYINAVVKNSGKIVAKLASKSSKTPNVSFALVTYKDTESDPNPINTFLSFPGTPDQVKQSLNIVPGTVGGGGDYPESVFHGLQTAIDLPWRAAPIGRKIILAGDAPPKDSVLGNEVYKKANELTIEIQKNNPKALRKLAIDTLSSDIVPAEPIEIYPIALGYDPAVAQSFQEIAEQTNGSQFIANNPDDIVDQILKAIDVIEDKTDSPSPVSVPEPTPPLAFYLGTTLALISIHKRKLPQAEKLK